MVRATRRGYYAPVEIIELKGVDGKKYKDTGRDDVMHNEGEVFEMDTSDMKPGKSNEMDWVHTTKGDFILPSWVTLVGKREKIDADDLVAAGHKTSFRPGDANVL